jgi:hypothetical protein
MKLIPIEFQSEIAMWVKSSIVILRRLIEYLVVQGAVRLTHGRMESPCLGSVAVQHLRIASLRIDYGLLTETPADIVGLLPSGAVDDVAFLWGLVATFSRECLEAQALEVNTQAFVATGDLHREAWIIC